MVDGIIIKGIGGFYYVKTKDEVIECRARGLFRENDLVPLIGDKVRIRISPEDNSGYVEEIYPRSSQLLRPPVANVTQAVIVNSIMDPKINPWLLDRFIVMAEKENIDILICLNKADLKIEEAKRLGQIYENIGYRVIITSTETGLGLDLLKSRLGGQISVFAGPSGVGKSSLLNAINENFSLSTGLVSSKTKRGKHTTRHVELLELEEDSFVLDTPGFGSLNIDFIEDETDLREYFIEIKEYGKDCRFLSCLHLNEPDCNVKKKLEDGSIDPERYKNYIDFLNEVKNIRRF